MANDFSVDELNEQLQRTNELLKAAEKRFEDLLKIVKNLQRNSSITGVASNATAEYNKRAEKKTLEWGKQMDKMMRVREQLLNLEYDKVGDLERERQERTRQFILERRKTAGMIEDAKTRRKEMSLQGKRLELYTKAIGSVTGGASGGLGGFIGMGVGSAIGGITAGAEGAREKTSGLQQRMLNYQQQAGQMEKTSIGTPTGKIQSNMLARLEKISPKLASFAYGKEGDDGTRKGGALGKGAGAMGKMGGVLGLAGGIGGGLLGGAIMKGLESSPMFQAVSKIMSTAFNLILRPIGDFFSAVFKPISIVLMKWGAVNLRKWAQTMHDNSNDAMKAADMIGKGLVAFFDDPLAFLSKAIEHLGEVIWTGKSNKLNDYITNAYTAIDKRLTTELGTMSGSLATGAGVVSGIQTEMKNSIDITKERAQKAQERLDEIAGNTEIIAQKTTQEKTVDYLKGEGADQVNDAYKKWVSENIEEQSKWWQEVGQFIEGLVPKQAGATTDILETVSEEIKFNYEKALEMSGITQEQWDKMGDDAKAVYQKYIEYRTAANTQEEENKIIQQTYMTMAKLNQDTNISIADYAKHAEQVHRTSYGLMQQSTKTSKGLVEDMAKEHEEMLKTIEVAYEKAKATLESLQRSSSRKSSSGAASNPWGRSAGGVIDERIYGIGERSGASYLFGEAGREYVVPENKTSGLGNISININIAKVSNDVDLQKLKPIIERAILETHARRGLI